MPIKRNWRPYEQAAAWAQAEGIRSVSEWRARSKQPDFPEDLPPSPDNAYKTVFPGWGVFLGTGTVAPQNKTFRAYADASAWAQAQGIRTQKEWQARCKDPDFPTDIPKNLVRGYADEFKGLGDFLGTGAVAAQKRVYRSHDEASAWAQEQGLDTRDAWMARAQQAGFPSDLPADPRKVYGDQFEGWPEFLQSGRLSNRRRVFRTVEQATQWAQGQGITDRDAWRERSQAADFPDDLPKNPSETYGAAFSGWGQFLGTGRIANQQRTFRPYAEAAAWAQAQGITSALHWFEETRGAHFPADLPKAPSQVYQPDFTEQGGWQGFLGQSSLRGTSKIEKALKRGLSLVLDLDPSTRATVQHDPDQRPASVDMVDRSRRLVIEYDGWFWHHTAKRTEQDRQKTLRLTRGVEPWTVIRVREAPLPAMRTSWDVQVPLPNGKFGPTIERVMQHLQGLILAGRLPDNGLGERLDRAMSQTLHESTFNDLFQMGWKPCEAAATWARAEGIRSHAQWRERCRAPGFPDDLPQYPDEAYGAAFGSWGAFLGTGVVASRNKTFRSYEAAQQWATVQGIKTIQEWRAKLKEPQAPADIPHNPDKVYRALFKGWGAFLGTGVIAHHQRQYRSWENASQWAQAEKIGSERQWRERLSTSGLPIDIPSNPARSYGKAFPGWGKFLGTGTIAPRDRVYRSYGEVSQWAQEQGITTEGQWRKACQRAEFPDDFPGHPQDVYTDFSSWGVFLGTGRQSSQQRRQAFRPYPAIAQWARQEGLRTARDWQQRCTEPDFPVDIPRHPDRSCREFPGWGTFLGTAHQSTAHRTFRPYDEAAAWAQDKGITSQEDWRRRIRQPDFPNDIPKAPHLTYGTAFQGWGAFLQTEHFQKKPPALARLSQRYAAPADGPDEPGSPPLPATPSPWRRPI